MEKKNNLDKPTNAGASTDEETSLMALARELNQKFVSGKMTCNQMREALGLKRLDDSACDEYVILETLIDPTMLENSVDRIKDKDEIIIIGNEILELLKNKNLIIWQAKEALKYAEEAIDYQVLK